MTRAGRLERVRRLRGACYWPTWACSPVDQWTAAATPEAIRRELGFVAGLGLDGVRLWTNAYGWERDPELYERNLTLALDRCAELGLAVDLVLFDSCGIDPELGDGRELALHEALAGSADDPLVKSFAAAAPSVDILESAALVQVPWRGQAIVAIWEGWTPNPGYYHLGQDKRPRWHRFAEGLLRSVRDHEALVLLEVMNEPFVTHLGHPPVDLQPIRDFYRDLHRLVVEAAPEVPVTIGAENLERFQDYESDLDRPLDVVSFHPLTYDPAQFRALLDRARAYADSTGRPALASEWGAFPGSHDEGQLRAYQQLLPVILESGVGWCQSHLIAGYNPFTLTAILYASGVMRPAAEYLRRTLLGGSSPTRRRDGSTSRPGRR